MYLMMSGRGSNVVPEREDVVPERARERVSREGGGEKFPSVSGVRVWAKSRGFAALFLGKYGMVSAFECSCCCGMRGQICYMFVSVPIKPPG